MYSVVTQHVFDNGVVWVHGMWLVVLQQVRMGWCGCNGIVEQHGKAQNMQCVAGFVQNAPHMQYLACFNGMLGVCTL